MTALTAQVNFIPAGQYSPVDLDRFLFELEARFKQKEVMRIEQAAEFLSCSVSKMYELCRNDKIPSHRVDGIGGRLFLKSELLDFIKKH